MSLIGKIGIEIGKMTFRIEALYYTDQYNAKKKGHEKQRLLFSIFMLSNQKLGDFVVTILIIKFWYTNLVKRVSTLPQLAMSYR